ncbi:MAG: thioredoxin domain-containing protein [Hyphomicrobiales bacterium]|nr:thioredoxin domain-containing protein [Hyphomicrobiales bacterium]
MNRLANALSPYLIQHADNPVHWYEWCDAAFEEARAENKPVLLSVGYSSCHWCHVMAHESFSDEEIAGVMNKHFVNIKVDREERPDVDALYMRALQLTGTGGGWPLTMFLTPKGEPFWGGTYFPPREKFGRPGFIDVLYSIARVYSGEPGKIADAVDAMGEGLAKLTQPQPSSDIAPDEILTQTRRFLEVTDNEHGGIPGGAPKFPQTQAMELLWRGWRRTGDSAARDAVLLAMERMCSGGIYDHLGGGFYRYSTDRYWLVPHFEKMLYDNALMISLLSAVWQDTRVELYRQRIEESVGWLLREMRLPSGAFASSLDADSSGGEGSFYVWREEEIDAILGDESGVFKETYDVSARGNWEGVCILNRLHGSKNADERLLSSLRARLLTEREKRERPSRDDKILSDWNGLAITALARASIALDRPEWMDAAFDAFAFIVENMHDGNGGLLHARRIKTSANMDESSVGAMAFSTDYAEMINAALTLYQLSGGEKFLRRALDWIGVLDRDYRVEDGAGYYDTSKSGERLLLRLRTSEDGAQPCANFVMAGVFAKLFHLTGESDYGERCAALLALDAGGLKTNFFSLAGLLCAADDFFHSTRVAVHGSGGESDVLLGIARRAPGPGIVVVRSGGETSEAVVCRGERCSLPVRDGELLRRGLSVPGMSLDVFGG